MNSLISVIIPVYNTKQYLGQCLDSLIKQTYRNLQIIIVDDGSTDGSGAICDEFAVRDGRITVVHQKNGGVSSARNTGLEIATGDWLFFLDSDDLLPTVSLETLCARICPFSLASGSMRELREGHIGEKGLALPDGQIEAKEMLRLLFHEEEQGYQGYLCNKLFDNRLISEIGLRFHTSISYNEDRLFITEYLLRCTSAVLCSETVYLYRIHEASAQGSLSTAFKSEALTELDAFERMYELLLAKHTALAHRVAWLCFEKALYWIGRIPQMNRKDRKKVRIILHNSARRCLSDPKMSLVGKAKIIAHCVLKR